ncbi:hypothetical protein TrRE_jg8128 [Triparma retinervis]|uniref:Uncharacterized protein n=1 Tax=Triparma retinervis TaxID=2557542 RepID=A0A9W7DY78_9STRA|nr:hypothetical protein TrRE_jg8128 [Triparma retinervis]
MERLPGEGEKERRERGDKENGGYAGSIGWGGREGKSGTSKEAESNSMWTKYLASPMVSMQRLRTPKAMTEMQRRTMRVRVDLRALLAGTEAWRRASACERGGCVSWRRLFTKSASSYSFGGNGLALLTAFEGFSSKCYLDSEGVETIGYGHACQSSSTDLPEYGVTCTSTSCSGTLTESQAREVLANDVATFVTCVRNAVTVDVVQKSVSVSYKYQECSGSCQYCSSCGGCLGSSYSFAGCADGGGGGGGGCDDGCRACIEGGGGTACAEKACTECSDQCKACVENGGGKACEERCV